MKLRIGRRGTWDAETIADASRIYESERDKSGEGSSTFPDGIVTDGKRKYRVSYNGRVWTWTTNAEWRSAILVHDNR